MDLRSYDFTPSQLEPVRTFIRQRKLAYQPFIFSDSLEVGEGFKFHEGEQARANVYWKGGDPSVADLLVSDQDLPRFRECNAYLRRIYDHMVDSIMNVLGGDISRLSFAEVGCNTGYFLHSLALRGAAQCIGFDFTNNDKVFEWFNRVLKTRTDFRFAEWDSLKHMLHYSEMPEVDVALSVAVTCHLADPLHHITYLCERARKAVFLWCPVNRNETLSLTFGQPGKYPNALDWPASFDNDVRMSIPLLELCLKEAGFGETIVLVPPELTDRWRGWWNSQRGIVAFRTGVTVSALSSGRNRRNLPPDAPFSSLGSRLHNMLRRA